jgi:ankyrin repeat protein
MINQFTYTLIVSAFLIANTFFGMEFSLTSYQSHPDLEETKKTLKNKGNTYSLELTNDSSLYKECVLNDYWKNISIQNQKAKDVAFTDIINLNFTDAGYSLWRYNIAAATLIGANPNIKDKCGMLALKQAAFKQDYELCKLLLEHNADPNLSKLEPIIFDVKTVALANLFLQYGAQTNVKHLGNNLLGVSMRESYECELIPLYKSKGVSPVDTDFFGSTALHYLAFNANNYHNLDLLKAKVDALFDGLAPREIIQIIKARQTNCGTISDVLTKYPDSSQNKTLLEYLKSIVNKYEMDTTN